MKAWTGSQFVNLGDFTTITPYTKYNYVLIVSQAVTELQQRKGDEERDEGADEETGEDVVGHAPESESVPFRDEAELVEERGSV